MKIATKRILSAILCLSMLLAMLLVPVSAAKPARTGRGVPVEEGKIGRKETKNECTSHSYDETTLLCSTCGAASPDAVAVVSKNGVNTSAYATLAEAIEAVADCVTEDEAVVTILQDIDLGEDYQYVYSGVFTLDLNGCCVTSNNMTVVYLSNEGIELTVTDSGEEGSIVGTGDYGIFSLGGIVTINGGEIIGADSGASINGGSIEVSGGKLTGAVSGVYAFQNASVEISGGELTATGEGNPYDIIALYVNGCADVSITGGTISASGTDSYGEYAEGIFSHNNTLNISGGSIYGEGTDICSSAPVVLTIGDDGEGATFPGGINVSRTTLKAILSEGAAYWQGDNMIVPDDDDTEITGGDVVIKTPCTHENGTLQNHVPVDTQSHDGFYSCCGAVVTEPHSVDDSDVCALCGFDMSKVIVINMTDDYGDGWNGNAIEVYADDTLLDTVTIESGTNAEWMQVMDPDAIYKFCWRKGSYAGECSFEIIIGGETVLTAGTSDCESFVDGQLLYTTCTHSYDDGVYSAPTCTADGGTTYTCSLCGDTYTEDVEAATGHSFGDDNICTVCGEVKKITINMQDSYGDGWTGNAIDIYADGELIGTATIEAGGDDSIPSGTDAPVAMRSGTTVTIQEGYSATWTIDYDSEKEYTFYWMKGNYPDECSFEIEIGGEVVLAADNETCAAYLDGQQVYPESEDGIIDLAKPVFVGGVELGSGEYLDLDGNVSETQPEGGFAYFDGSVLTLNNYVYEGTGKELTFTFDGEEYPGVYALIYTESNALEINLVGESTISSPDETQSFGILLGDITDNFAENSFTLSGTGTLNMSGENMILINATHVTIEGGTWNVSAYLGIDSPDGDSTMTVDGGELNFTITGDEWSSCLRISYVTVNDGKLVLSSTNYLAMKVARLTVNGGYLEVKQGGMEACEYNGTNMITLAEGVSITSPEGAVIVNGTNNNGLPTQTIGNADGTVADAFIIQAVCEHEWSEATCEEPATCALCGETDGEALGHSYENGFCEVCGDYEEASLNEDGYYEIANGGNLFWFAKYVNDNDAYTSNAVLTADIDLESKNFTSIEKLTGVIDGANFKITNFYQKDGFGLVKVLEDGGIKNLTIEATIENEWLGLNGDCYFGVFAGDMLDSALYNCHASGTIDMSIELNGYAYIGGIVGEAEHSVIMNCVSECDISVESNDSGTRYIGGIAGCCRAFEPQCILNSYAYCDIKYTAAAEIPNDYVGGIAGYMEDDAVNNYFYGAINSGGYGGAFGYLLTSAMDHLTGGTVVTFIYENNFYPATMNGLQNNPNADGIVTGISAEELAATEGETALVNRLNEHIPETMQIVLGHRGYLNESEWAEIVELVGGEAFTLMHWKVEDGHPVFCAETEPNVACESCGYLLEHGWSDGKYIDHGTQVSGWFEIDGDWYYFDEETGLPKTGLSRVPYPEDEIDGNTYTPDAEALAYYEGKGEAFIDATEGWFCFNEDGVFQSDFNGMIETDDKNTYLENGFAVWNPGLVELDDGYYYFVGDTENGGNKPAVGNCYVGKNNTDLDITLSGVYTFDEDGKLCEYDGIVEIGSALWYYEDYQLMLGKGLIKIEEDYYYVRSDGSLAVNQSYWVANVNEYTEITVGMYDFDSDGKLIIPEPEVAKHGVYFENSAWYYYENGVKGYNKGLIVCELSWYNAEGEVAWDKGGTIYVRSNGQLATGAYYVTNLANYTGTFNVKVGDFMRFNKMGILQEVKNGIVAEKGSLYYYINDRLQYNAGVIEIDGNYYYVRSNGEVVNNRSYWITNVGDSGVIAGKYVFDANGVMQNPLFELPSIENGIHAGYYYIDGKIAYNAGLLYFENEGYYIYVRSNGMIATGKYWITNHNDLLTAGLYDFGEDGKLFR